MVERLYLAEIVGDWSEVQIDASVVTNRQSIMLALLVVLICGLLWASLLKGIRRRHILTGTFCTMVSCIMLAFVSHSLAHALARIYNSPLEMVIDDVGCLALEWSRQPIGILFVAVIHAAGISFVIHQNRNLSDTGTTIRNCATVSIILLAIVLGTYVHFCVAHG